MLHNIKYEVVQILSTVQIQNPEEVEAVEEERRRKAAVRNMNFEHVDTLAPQEAANGPADPAALEDNVLSFRREGPKVGRNDPCPCGSGKKYKHCCGRL